MLLDILALRYMYDANMATRAGGTAYSWAPSSYVYETIWEAGGNDTFD